MIRKGSVLSAESVLREIESISKRGFLPIIGPVKGKFLTDAVRQYSVRRALEVGTLIGYSAILIASNMPSNGQVFTIEINPRSAETALDNIRRAGLADMVRIYIGDALELIPEIDEEFDMVFLDAAKNEYLDYLKLSESRLKKGGIVVADNVKIFAGQMRNFLDYVRDSGKYRSRFFDAGFDGVEVSEKLF